MTPGTLCRWDERWNRLAPVAVFFTCPFSAGAPDDLIYGDVHDVFIVVCSAPLGARHALCVVSGKASGPRVFWLHKDWMVEA